MIAMILADMGCYVYEGEGNQVSGIRDQGSGALKICVMRHARCPSTLLRVVSLSNHGKTHFAYRIRSLL